LAIALPDSQELLEATLRDQVGRVLRLPAASIDVQQPLHDLGLDSLMALEFFARIEKRFGKRLPLATLLHAPTLAQLADILYDDEWKPNWSPLVPIQANGTRLPFFCVHGHHGNVLRFYPLASYLGPEQPFYAIQARGLGGHLSALARGRLTTGGVSILRCTLTVVETCLPGVKEPILHRTTPGFSSMQRPH